MSTQLVRTILRLVAVFVVFGGVLGASTALLSAFAMIAFADNVGHDTSFRSSMSGFGLISVFTWLVVIAWGAALFHFSPTIARMVTSEPETAGSQSRSVRGETLRG
jgi:uncharacterized membrane protein YccF (DUF307 family)